MRPTATLCDTTLVGFDSAWADRAGKPGAICAMTFDAAGDVRFDPPTLVDFAAATAFVEARHAAERRTLVAIDQPTIVRNPTGMRPCERVVASVASWSGGGVQPANREGKAAMFGDGAPIWRFLDRLAFRDDPEAARATPRGGFVMEVFPALALLDFDPAFAAPRGSPRYNPAPRTNTFSQEHWCAVLEAVAATANDIGLEAAADWCHTQDRAAKPRKRTQDALDSIICLIVAALWLLAPKRCAMIGDLEAGYIVAPVGEIVRQRLAAAAVSHDVRVELSDIVIPGRRRRRTWNSLTPTCADRPYAHRFRVGAPLAPE